MKNIKDLNIGDELQRVELDPVSRIDLIKYAGASGDYNPIHTIDEKAKSLGLPGVIAHGMWTMGNLAKLFTPFYHQGFLKDYTIRFKGMVFLDDVITLKAKLREIDGYSYIFNVAAQNQQSKDVIKGEIVYQII
ncbi:dehydratase [Bacillus sp. BGMRC 2118]|nr:dehydratase [Bacillus sp. BGMRC 2118]